jgi:phosphoglycerol transferase MdoB-like AlkP superfamily enzyme
MRRPLRFVPPRRFAVLLWVAGLFLAFNGAVRLGLMVFDGDPANFAVSHIAAVLSVGLLYDLAAVVYVLVPFALLAGLLPDNVWGRKAHAAGASGLVLFLIFGVLFVCVAEALFWNEFSARFNFIAVDYLVYTRETLGNIRESYPVAPLLAALAVAAGMLFFFLRRPIWAAGCGEGGPLSRRFPATLVILMLPVLSFFAVGDGPREALPTASMRELAGNGYYDFGRAFRSNDLDFNKYYLTLPEREAIAEMREEFEEAASTAKFTNNNAHPLERVIKPEGAPKLLNVVLVTIESLGADFVGSLGGKAGLTPNLDRLAREGLLFKKIYATGLRTVRGLEALSLSLPPTPGQAVLKRHNNKGYQTLGEVLKDNGYDPLFLYGGYSYFDNMADFFGGNGYTVVDRSALSRSEISHETIWGVADEDLFKLVTREMDARTAAGRKVLAHIMTTSNHRPFTYPAGRVDIPSGSGRDGAVKYTDWAIGKFMEVAAARPWFKDTVFVFIADHTSHGRGRTDLPPENFHIPLIFYSPSHIAPAEIDSIASQIDVAPTLLAMLNVGYTSHFFGQDILTEGKHHQRALMANYLTVGHLEGGIMVELGPKKRVRVVEVAKGREIPSDDPAIHRWIREAIAYYQVASGVVRRMP